MDESKVSLSTYNGRDGEVVLLSILEEAEHVVTDDDTGLAGQLVEDTHCGRRSRKISKFSYVERESRGQQSRLSER